MKLSRLVTEHSAFTIIVLLILLLIGILSFLTMPRSEDPQFDFSAAGVTVVYPGVSPTDLESLVADPLEEEINALDDVELIETVIRDGVVSLRVEFSWETDPDEVYDDVSQAVSNLTPELPAGIVDIEVRRLSPSEVAVLQLALVSEHAPYLQLSRLADDLERKLERIDGVRRATVRGIPRQQVEVALDWERMAVLGVDASEVVAALQAGSRNLAGGFVNAGSSRLSVSTSGDYRSLDEIRQSVVRAAGGKVVALSDVARVRQADAEDDWIAHVDGRRAVFITLTQRKGSNIFEVRRGIDQLLEQFRRTLPPTVSLELAFDQAPGVDRQVNGFFDNLYQGLALVGLLVVLVLGARAAVVVMVAIPASLLIAVGWIDISGFGLQQMTIVGLIVALGLLVDNAIVITESIGQAADQGFRGMAAAREGLRRVGTAVFSGTLTTALAFLPMLMLPNNTGSFMRSMPATVVLTLLASLLVAMTLSTLLAGRFLAWKKRRLPLAQRRLQHFAAGGYRRLLEAALRFRWLTLVTAVLLLVASLSLIPQVGVSLFPKAEKPMLLVNIDLPGNSSIYRTRQVALEISEWVREQPEVRSVIDNVGAHNPRIYYNESPSRAVPDQAQLLVHLQQYHHRRVGEMIGRWRQKLGDYPGARIRVRELQQGPPTGSPIAIRLKGDKLEALVETAARVESQMRSMPGLVNIDNPLGRTRMELQVDINRQLAALSGIAIGRIDEVVRTALAGLPVGDYRDERGDNYPIVVRLADSRDPRVAHLEQIRLRAADGRMVSLKQIADFRLTDARDRLLHHNLERTAILSADAGRGESVAALTAGLATQLAGLELPEGVRVEYGGEEEERGRSFAGMAQALVIALLGILAVLVAQFRSLSQPLIVVSAVPFAIVGAVTALWLSGHSFSVMAFVGLNSLVGIVVNNSIILVDAANQLRREGVAPHEAVLRSAQSRLLPILLTSLTTVAGLLPLTLEGSTLWAPMGWAIIGGMLVSTMLTLVLVPVLYLLVDGRRGPQDLSERCQSDDSSSVISGT